MQLLLALFFAIVPTRSSPGLFVGEYNAPLPLRCGGGDADRTNCAGRRTGGIVNEFISMLPKFNKELTRKLFNCRRCCLFLIYICRRSECCSDGLGKSGYLHHGANDRAFRGMASVLLLVMTVVFMLFEVRPSLTKCVLR